jgi:hypothetical protein
MVLQGMDEVTYVRRCRDLGDIAQGTAVHCEKGDHFLSGRRSADGRKVGEDLRQRRTMELLRAYVESALDLIHAGLANSSLQR